ncbi:hypothetical protein V2J09_023443 [Rumex salicifolius]
MTKIPLYLLFLLLPITVISHSLSSQRSTLLSIKNQWGNPSTLSSWSPATSPCSWYGIQCSTKAAVTGITLYKAEINLKIPPSICDLKTLKTLNLSWNNISGGFPTVLGSCSALTILDLSANLFVGPIPDDVDKLLPPSLQYLNLNENNFSEGIPKSIGALKELKTLYLTQNSLEGTFPSEISNLSKLEDLQMDKNHFAPMALPSEWGKLKSLKVLIMNECNLVGEIPESFGGLLSLEHLDLGGNGIVGRIPDGLFMLKGLRLLYLNDNKLSGGIPSSVQALNLSVVDLYNNKLSGSIPMEFGNLTRLMDLSLFNNSLSGEIPASIGLLPELEILKLFYNNLSGPLPPELGLHSKFRIFEIAGNQFSGPLPENLCSRVALIGITAFSNNLSGEIPKSLEKCTTLGTLMFYNNNFTGEIPAGIWTLPALYSLMFSFNGFTGPLPDRIAENITRLEINNNKFTGQIPNGIARWTNLQVLSAGNNMFSGSFPLGLTRLSQLQILSLEGNQLSGELPLNVRYSWTALSTLNLAGNEFSGPIPGAIGSLPTLSSLDLSNNAFSGEIPVQFEQLKVISFLNLCNNKLLGKIPYSLDNGAFARSFLNNTRLCTSDKSQILTLPRCSISLSSKASNHLSSKHLAMILVLAMIVLLVTLKLTVYLIQKNERRKYNDELTSWKFTPFHTLEFTEAEIISSLYEHHVIGSGGSGKVYRVQVDDSGYSVAVKRIWNNHKLDNAQFLAEVQILGDIRHEYRYTKKVNEKIDVYSFGVVLLEIATGKEPNGEDESLNLADWCWRHCCEDMPIVEALDKEVVQDHNLEEMSIVFKLGIACTSPRPNTRPSMKDVLEILRRSSQLEKDSRWLKMRRADHTEEQRKDEAESQAEDCKDDNWPSLVGKSQEELITYYIHQKENELIY